MLKIIILVSQPSMLMVALFEFIHSFAKDYPSHYIVHTQHDCPSQMNSNLMISVTKSAVANHQIFIHFWGTTMQDLYNQDKLTMLFC